MQRNLLEISDNQAEATVIATLLAHPDMVAYVDEVLKPGHFLQEETRCFYWAIRELYRKGIENFDAVNLSNIFNTNKAVAKKISEYNIGNLQEYIEASRFASRDTPEELREVSNRIIELAFKRALYNVCEEVERDCFKDNYSLDRLNSEFNNKVEWLTKNFVVNTDIENFGMKVDDLWESVVSHRTSNGYGVPSKFQSLAKYTSYEPSNLYVYKGRYKQGKSAVLMNEAIYMLQNNLSCVYIDSEISDELFFIRMLANISGVEIDTIKRGSYSKEQEQRVMKAKNWLKTRNFVHIYMTNPQKDQIYAICKRLKYSMGCQVVFYDYIKCNEGDGSVTANILGDLTDFLKNRICGELNLIGITAVQLNRQGEVADSDKIERYASFSCVWRFKDQEELAQDGLDGGNCMMRVDVNRNGMRMEPDERINFVFDAPRMRIIEAKKQPDPTDIGPFGNNSSE